MSNAQFTGFDGNINSHNTAVADGLLISMKDYASF